MRRMGMMMRKTGNQRKSVKSEKMGGGLRASRKSSQGEVPSFMLPETKEHQTFVQEQDIIDGTWLLYNLEFEDEAYTAGGSDYQGQVYGLFCKIDLAAQKDDPSKGMFSCLFG